MRINAAGLNTKFFRPAFKSIRTDKNAIEQLKNGEQPIIDNNKQNIYAALNNLAADPNRDNIEFLLDVAENIAYGQGGSNSDFKDFLDSESLTPSERENTDWLAILDDTVRRAISTSTEDVSDLEGEYNRVFSEKREMTPEQKKLIELRAGLTSLIINESSIEDSETLALTARVRKNLDYFLASSEIPIKQKQYCLEKFMYFMSDDYKITPQLQDKKLQVVDEMLNDMLIKTPESPYLTIKTVDQRQTGMCAAISICRKQMAYEDKANYVDLILEELKDSPVMSVYDITELGSGKKVDIYKTQVDYNTALRKGYRIIDTSAHNWMHNAHASGDGTIQTECYVPFSDDEYGVYNDSSWYLGVSEDNFQAKSLLQALIKEKEFLKSLLKMRKEMQQASKNMNAVKKEVYDSFSAAAGKLNAVFKSIFPDKTDKELTQLQHSLLKYYSGKTDDNEVNISEKLPKDVKQKLIADFITASVPDITDEQKEKISQNSSVIYLMLEEYTSAEDQLAKINRFNTKRSKYLYKRKLFNAAAAHRLAMEEDVNMPDGIIRFERLTGLPVRNKQVADYLKSLRPSFTSPSVRKKWTDENGNIPDKEKLEQELLSDIVKVETTIPSKLNLISQTLLGMSISQLAASMFLSISQSIQGGDLDVLNNTKELMDFKCDKNKVIEKLNKWAEKLSDSPSMEETFDALRLLGYEDSFEFLSLFISTFFNSLKNGISQEQFDALSKRLGGDDNVPFGLEAVRSNFQSLQEEYAAIEEKWHVPSARENILRKLEKSNSILSRRKLDMLKNKFDSIEAAMAKNEKIANTKERKAANDKLYKFSEDYEEIFASIEKSVAGMKKYCKMQYKSINKALKQELEEQYAYIGKLNGQFWVREEGTSGLTSNEQIRILEQMTGKPYHLESDIIDAAKEIKKGNGSGIISLSVDDKDYAFHAQYVPSVTSEVFTSPVTSEQTVRDIIWTDNTWGDSEKEYFWNGHNGFYYTDYDRNFGWKDGFVLAPDKRIGLPVDSIHGAVGVAKEDNEKFGLFSDVILQGTPVDSYQKLYKMFHYIFNMQEGETFLSNLESAIKAGAKFNIENLEGLDSLAEFKENKIAKRIETEIKTKEDFDKLPEDDELKFAFKKLAVYMSTNNPEMAESILTIDNQEDLDKASEEIFEEHLRGFSTIMGKSSDTLEKLQALCEQDLKEQLQAEGISLNNKLMIDIIAGIFSDEESISESDGSLKGLETYLTNRTVSVISRLIAADNDDKHVKDIQKRVIDILTGSIQKNIDEHVRIASLDSKILTNSPLGNEFIAAVDKYLKPESDQELLFLIQGLQMVDSETAEGFIMALEPEDVGVKCKDPYYYLQLYKAEDFSVIKALSEIITTQEIYSNINESKDDETSTPEELYRTMFVKLSDLNVQKYVKAFKAEAFQKYNVRQAFPQPVVLSDESIGETIKNIINIIEDYTSSIKSDGYLINILDKYSAIADNFAKSPIYRSIMQMKDFEITEENADDVQAFLNALISLYDLTSKDESLQSVNEPLEKLIFVIGEADKTIDGKTAGAGLKELVRIFNEFESTGVTKDKFIITKRDELNTLNRNVQLMVNINVEPRYRNDAIHLLNGLVEMYRKNAPEDELNRQKELITQFIIDKHIIKNPPVLLKECVKLLMAGKSESDEYTVLRKYLISALKVAQQTKIQYKMVQNQHAGLSSKLKDMLPMFEVCMPDGSEISMEDELGLLYIIEQLKNEDDNFETLKLFLEQSGLSAKAIRATINNYDMDKVKEFVDEKSEKILDSIKNIEILGNEIESFFASSRIKYKDVEDVVNQLNSYLKRKFKNYEQIPVIKNYIGYLDSLVYGNSYSGISQSMIITLARQVSTDALQNNTDEMTSELENIHGIAKMLEEQALFLSSISIPKSSEEYALREDFLKKYAEAQEYIKSVFDEVKLASGNSNVIYAETGD